MKKESDFCLFDNIRTSQKPRQVPPTTFIKMTLLYDPSFRPIMEAANLSKEKKGKVVDISLCNGIKIEEIVESP